MGTNGGKYFHLGGGAYKPSSFHDAKRAMQIVLHEGKTDLQAAPRTAPKQSRDTSELYLAIHFVQPVLDGSFHVLLPV